MRAKPKVKIELTRLEAYQIIRAFRRENTDTQIGNKVFAIVEDAICHYDEAQRREEREKEK